MNARSVRRRTPIRRPIRRKHFKFRQYGNKELIPPVVREAEPQRFYFKDLYDDEPSTDPDETPAAEPAVRLQDLPEFLTYDSSVA